MRNSISRGRRLDVERGYWAGMGQSDSQDGAETIEGCPYRVEPNCSRLPPSDDPCRAKATKSPKGIVGAVVPPSVRSAETAAAINVAHVIGLAFDRRLPAAIGRAHKRSLIGIEITKVMQHIRDHLSPLGIQLWVRIVVAALDDDGKRRALQSGGDFIEMIATVNVQFSRFAYEIVEVHDEVTRFAISLHSLKMGPLRHAQGKPIGYSQRTAAGQSQTTGGGQTSGLQPVSNPFAAWPFHLGTRFRSLGSLQ